MAKLETIEEVTYEHYLYGIKKVNVKEIATAFNFGVVSKVGPDLNRCTIKVGEDAGSVKEVARYSGYKCVFVISIPKMFLTPKIKNYKLTQMPVPIWQADTDGTHILKSNLIHGAYNVKLNQYFPNKFYNEVYCPNGLLFDRQQSEYFAKNNILKWMAFDDYRQCRSFVELKRIDRQKTIWTPLVDQYTKFYNSAMVKKLDTRVFE